MDKPNEPIVEYDKLVKNLLCLRQEVMLQDTNHCLGLSTHDVLEKINLCLTTDYAKKK